MESYHSTSSLQNLSFLSNKIIELRTFSYFSFSLLFKNSMSQTTKETNKQNKTKIRS